MSLDVLISYLGGFLHHVSQITGHRQDSLPLAHGALYEEDLTSHSRPGQSGNHSRSLITLLHIVRVGRKSQILTEMLLLDHSRIFLFQSNLLRRDTSYLGYLLLQSTHT